MNDPVPGIINLLKNNVLVNNNPVKVRAGFIEEPKETPLITVRRTGLKYSYPIGTGEPVIREHEVRVSCWGRTHEEVQEIASQVDELLRLTSLTGFDLFVTRIAFDVVTELSKPIYLATVEVIATEVA